MRFPCRFYAVYMGYTLKRSSYNPHYSLFGIPVADINIRWSNNSTGIKEKNLSDIFFGNVIIML